MGGGLVVEDDDDDFDKVGRYENKSPFTRFPIVVVVFDGISEECDVSLTSKCENVSCSGDGVVQPAWLIAIVDETSEKVSCSGSGDGDGVVDFSWLIAIASSRRCEYLGANNVGGITTGGV